MNTIKVQPLTAETFAGYGTYTNMLDPQGFLLGSPPGGFYRDMLTVPMPSRAVAGLSVSNAVYQETPVVGEIECHDGAAEAFMPLDGDIMLLLGEATIRSMPPVNKMRALYVPKGTMVVINAGVWHSGSYAVSGGVVHVLTILPERTYALDCYFHKLGAGEELTMEIEA